MTLKDRISELEAQNKLLAEQGTLMTQSIKNLDHILRSIKTLLEAVDKNIFISSTSILKLMHEHYSKEEVDVFLKNIEEQYKTNKDFEKIITQGFNPKKEM